MDIKQDPRKIRKAENVSRNWKALLKVRCSLVMCFVFIKFADTRGRRCNMTTKAAKARQVVARESLIKKKSQGKFLLIWAVGLCCLAVGGEWLGF